MAVIEEFNYLCRLCATKTGIMIMGFPIFEPGERLRNIDKKIAACLPVQVSTCDDLPKVICQPCAYKLDEMFDFREKCLHTEELFIEMLKEELKNEAITIDNTLTGVDEIPNVMQADIRGIHNHNHSHNHNHLHNQHHHDIGDMQNGIVDELRSQDCVGNDEVPGDTGSLHTMRVMDDMELAGGEQVVSQEEIPDQETIEVTGIECLNGETVGIDEHIHEVSNHQIAIHLDGDMTVVGNLTVNNHLGINYVTAIVPEQQTEDEQILHYCENVKYEGVDVKEEYQRLQLSEVPPSHSIESSSETFVATVESTDTALNSQIPSPELPSTSQEASKPDPVEYTKESKDTLIENVISNPSIDQAGAKWYICPFCSEMTNEPSSLLDHYDQHFCSCPCGLNFVSLEDFNTHEQQCPFSSDSKSSIANDNLDDESSTSISVLNSISESANEVSCINNENEAGENEKLQSGVRPKWTPKICTQCGKQYRTNYKLQEHMRKHTGEKPFQCKLCEKAFRSKIGLAQHTATHTGQFDYSCSTCGKGFQCKSYLIVHQRVHSDLKPYSCDTCGQSFKTKQSLLDHQNRHLGVKPYVCEICGRSFITKGLCKSHQKIHSGTDNRQYPCQVCNKMFVSKSYLNTHLRIHTGEKPYLCEVCGKGFLTRVDLRIHSTMHTGEKSFKCEICNKVFARRAALRCHRRSHTGERPYRCDVCGKTFTQFSPMTIHKRLHTGERPYECDVCRKTFVSKSTMMCHRKKHRLSDELGDKDTGNEEGSNVGSAEVTECADRQTD
ncbi:zinc finger protein 260-like [Cotesia glomerata]|uniref:Zinc finger protein n=1 Tax=Cotesia glomerata TaxID=32391 RepID=A0AAV7J9X7_COTGL|nr:zinc finger protein 260-like [Cotesia glomerata]KAH0569008.1 hypothetical protein KQX54_021714 [Cotesia glomerata]